MRSVHQMEIKGSYPEGGSLGNHIVIQREIKSVREMEIKSQGGGYPL
jgi:hypothetical protein